MKRDRQLPSIMYVASTAGGLFSLVALKGVGARLSDQANFGFVAVMPFLFVGAFHMALLAFFVLGISGDLTIKKKLSPGALLAILYFPVLVPLVVVLLVVNSP